MVWLASSVPGLVTMSPDDLRALPRRQRGYLPRPDVSCVFDWRELGDDRETPHAMGFWLKEPL